VGGSLLGGCPGQRCELHQVQSIPAQQDIKLSFMYLEIKVKMNSNLGGRRKCILQYRWQLH
jgi:hypothetical protein